MPKPLSLTFGIEIECIISFDPAKYEPGLEHATDIFWTKQLSSRLSLETKLRILFRKYIGDFLRDNGVPTYEMTSRGGDQQWTVTNDTSIDIKDGPRAGDGFMECDIEIKSPALSFCSKALHRVQRVVRLLRKKFNVFANTSCGLHVHIGNQNKGFPLRTLKNLSMLTAMFEHQLNGLHPAHRIGNQHAKGPSAVFGGQSPWDTVQAIHRCKTKEALVFLYKDNEGQPDRCFAYNLCPMVYGPYKTIEFRQHEATLEWPKIMNWVQVAGGIVDAMHQISASDLAQLIGTCAFDPGFTVSDLLLWLGLDALIPCYSGGLHAYQRPGPIPIPRRVGGNANAVPRWLHGLGQWNERERDHRLESLEKLERVDVPHVLEWLRELGRDVQICPPAKAKFIDSSIF